MKYIKRVILENFQSHKYTEIDLNNYLNIIVGASDSGKTAIFRGIKWVLYNEPLGDFFIREGSTQCRVSLIMNNGTKVERFRSKSKNSYHLFIEGQEEMIFEGFGHKVPKEISDAIGIKRINLDQNETRSINLAEQLDGAFLLSETGSVKASSIGRLVGVNIIDDALRESLNDSRRLNIEGNSLDKAIEELEEEVGTFEYLNNIEKNLKSLIETSKSIKEKELLVRNLDEKKKLFSETQIEIGANEKIINSTKNINSLENKISKLELLFQKKKNLNTKKINYFKINDDIKINENIMVKLEKIELANDTSIKLKNKLKSINKYEKYNDLWEKTNKMNQQYSSVFKRLSRLDKIDMNNQEEKINRFLKLLRYNELLNDINNRLSIGRDFYNKFNSIEESNLALSKIDNLYNKLNILYKYKKDFKIVFKNIELITTDITENRNNINNLLNEYKMLLEKQETCPLCFSKIDEGRINIVINQYKKELKI